MKPVLLTLSALGLALAAGCASKTASEATNTAYVQTRAGFAEAAMTPLEDLNLRRDEIPPALEAVGNPYEFPAEATCAEIETHITGLNNVLGPDWDAPPGGDETPLSERAGDAASDGILGTVASEAGGILPYRGWVRRLSGANAHEKKIKQAYDRGAHRRTYLKALGLMKGCDPVAVPQLDHGGEDQTRIVFNGDAPAGYVPPGPDPQAAPSRTAQTLAPPKRTDLRPAEIEAAPLDEPASAYAYTGHSGTEASDLPDVREPLQPRPAPRHEDPGMSRSSDRTSYSPSGD